MLSPPSLYGGSYNLFKNTLSKLGIEPVWVEDPDSLDSWRAAVKPTTKAFFAETIPPNPPRQDVLDVEGVSAVAHEAGVPLIVDNTIASPPYLLRPIEHGADVVVHSATKFLGGHGTAIGGVIVDGGRFDFGAEPERFPLFNEPDRRTTVWSTASSPPPCRPMRSEPASPCCGISVRRSPPR